MTSLTARLAAAALAVPLVIATAGTANAGSKWTYKSSGSFASVSWMEVGELPAPVLGNYHVGYLDVRGDKVVDVFGEVTDWTCPEGELPPEFGGGHGEEEPETDCTLESSRFIYADPGAITFTVDRKLNAATLVGNLIVSDHEGEGTATPPVNMTLDRYRRHLEDDEHLHRHRPQRQQVHLPHDGDRRARVTSRAGSGPWSSTTRPASSRTATSAPTARTSGPRPRDRTRQGRAPGPALTRHHDDLDSRHT